jgi:hypothetical protein
VLASVVAGVVVVVGVVVVGAVVVPWLSLVVVAGVPVVVAGVPVSLLPLSPQAGSSSRSERGSDERMSPRRLSTAGSRS